MDRHYPVLLAHQKSYARLSTNAEAKTCIVFVHGFFGNVTKTWEYFADLCDSPDVPDAAFFEHSDLYFFDYPAQKAFVKHSASELAEFLNRLFPRPAMDLFHLGEEQRVAVRAPWIPYSQLILVGHSLGAVVIRECIENQFRLPHNRGVPTWIGMCEIRLFGAAHIGFKVSGRKELLYSLSPEILLSFPLLWRAFSDLQPSSSVLVSLRSRTESLAKLNPEQKCFRALLLYGTEEDIVIPGEFDCDYVLEWQKGMNNTQVCKPDESFRDPIKVVTRHAEAESARA